ncbi:endonuclease [Candidatus Woesearchaeota archaeon]|nr:endonuclease [Candidatus Woesearchaeota archaeon]
MEKINKILEIYNILLKEFRHQGWWPINQKYLPADYSKPETEEEILEICLGTILTQNTSWKNVEKALVNLQKNNLFNLKNLQKIDVKKLAEIIKSSGYNNQKARKIKEFINFLESKKEITRENLLKIWGIGPETADSILLYVYKKPYFVIDAYTKRIFNRLGFKEAKYEELQNLFIKNLEKNHRIYNEYHALLVKLGKDICKTKPLCDKCPLNKICKYNITS